MPNILREELKRFGLTTSMKGLPRAINSEFLTLRIFWSTATIILFSFTCFQAYTLVASYLENAVVTGIHEEVAHPDEVMLPLPVATICSRSPMSATNLMNLEGMSPAEYTKRVGELMNCDGQNCEAETRAKQILTTSEGYFQNVGWQTVSTLAHQADIFIASCTAATLLGIEIIQRPCGDYITVATNFHPKFFNCFDLKHNQDRFGDGVVLGLSVVLYLDHNASLARRYPFESEAFYSGAIAQLTKDGIESLVLLNAIDIPAGSEVKVKIQQKFRKRLHEPLGNCRNYTKAGPVSDSSCLTDCLRDQIHRECGCKEPATPYVPNNDSLDDLCLSLSHPKEKVLQRLACRDATLSDNISFCLRECPLACEETLYDVEIQAHNWPMPSYYGLFYDKIIKGRPYEEHFSYIDSLAEGSFIPNNIPINSSTKLINDNFARFSFALNDHKFYRVTDVQKVTMEELMSQLGGSLNLWFGITVLVALEIMELIHRICQRLCDLALGKRKVQISETLATKVKQTSLSADRSLPSVRSCSTIGGVSEHSQSA